MRCKASRGAELKWSKHANENASDNVVSKRRRWLRRALLASTIATIIGIAVLIWFSLVLALVIRLRPSRQVNGLEGIVKAWQKPSDSTRLLSPWPIDFSRDIIPKSCHSHNDYWRRVPLFDALAAGCTSVEADIWLPEQQDSTLGLRVGHKASSLSGDRTLASLYVQPLVSIMENIAGSQDSNSSIFETDPSQTFVLVLDFKSDGPALWPHVNAQLEALRGKSWLRHWNGMSRTIVPGPLTIVATGTAPWDLIVANTTYRDIFYDAPLVELNSDRFNISNSFFASASLGQAVGKPSFGKFNSESLTKMTSQIANAKAKGLVSRYWDTPAWPINVRDRVWNTLVSNEVGTLNVDDLESATRWNWDWCVVAGINLCG